jgi:glycosyltransferase involved in cell wall biosynthesis
VVQTLHNFRFFCPGALFLRDGKPCEECVDKGLLQSVRHRCYRGSLAATATLASMLAMHRALGTYAHHIDRYIALTQFAKSKMIRGGIDASKLAVKPNFVPDPPPAGAGAGGYVAYVGRLLHGKGTETLLAAWRQLPDVKLKIVGDGALRGTLEAAARDARLDIEFTGRLPRCAVLEIVAAAEFLIVPSEWYEGFPMVIAESFACGTPVLAARIGSLQELVLDGIHGGQFEAGNHEDLARHVRSMLADDIALRRMRLNVRSYFEANLSEDQNYAQLMAVYSHVLRAERQSRRKQG